MNFTDAEKQVLIAVAKVTQDGKIANQQTIERFNTYFFGETSEDWPVAVDSLEQRNLLRKTGKTLIIKPDGMAFARKYIGSLKFKTAYSRCSRSTTFKTFCQRVYGQYLCQFNAVDMDQLEGLIHVLKLDVTPHVLDVGCGIGIITEYISDRTGASMAGLDFTSGAIEMAAERTRDKRPKLSFQEGDMNDFVLPPASFDTVIIIDATQYMQNIYNSIGQLKKILQSGGQMGIFFTQLIPSPDAKQALEPENTLLARILLKHGLQFSTTDYTDSEKQVWRQSKKILQELHHEFEEEGFNDIFLLRSAETEYMLPFAGSGRLSRYLYHVLL